MTARPPATFPALLDDLLRTAPGRPLVTFYDRASGERVELSVTTYANWVAKTASLLVEECDLERGQRLLVDLPTHWLGPVALGAAWTAGLVVVLPEAPGGVSDPGGQEEPDAVFCGPDGLATWAPRATSLPVVASALLPLGVRFASPPPSGVRDFGADVWGQPDAFVPLDPPTGDDEAVPGTTQEELLAGAAGGRLLSDGGRLMTAANPVSPAGLATFTEPLVRGGSLVLLAHPDGEGGGEGLDALRAAERVTHRA